MTAAIAAATVEELQSIPLELIDVLPNTRKVYNQQKLEELAESLVKLGQLQPVLVRPKGERYELVYGTRRRLAACIAKLATLLARVRNLTDEEVLEVQIVENAQRDDITPLEEAEAYRELHDRFKRSADEIAAKIGKSREHVYARMKLCALAPEPRKALAEGKLSPSAALAVARIPVASLQKEATKDLLRGDEPVSAREAVRFVQSKYMLKLADAPFNPKDPKLVPKAGACGDCPKYGANQPDLSKELGKGANVCTDPTCFEAKRDAAWKNRAAEAKKQGQTVLSEKEVKKLFPYGRSDSMANNSPYVALDAACYEDPKNRTYRYLLAKAMPQVSLARTESGKVHELVERKSAAAAMKELGHNFAKAKASSRPADEVQREKKAKVMRETQRLAMTEMVKRAEERQPDEKWARVFVDALIDLASNETVQAILKRRGLAKPTKKGVYREPGGKALRVAAAKMTIPQVRGLVVELAAHGSVGPWHLSFGERFNAFAKLYGVDPAKFKPAPNEKKAAKKEGGK